MDFEIGGWTDCGVGKDSMDSSAYYPGKENIEDWPDEHPVQELSSEIDRLRAENERLREIMSDFVHEYTFPVEQRSLRERMHPILERARKALGMFPYHTR